MSLRHLLRHRLYAAATTTRSPISITLIQQRFYNISFQSNDPSQSQTPPNLSSPAPSPQIQNQTVPSPAEAAEAKRRELRRKKRIEPPLHALRPRGPPPKRDPNAPRLPESTSSLVGHRLNLHNRVQSLIRASDLDAASRLARNSVFSTTRPTVFTCNAIIAAMYRSKRYAESISLFEYFFERNRIVPNVVSYNQIINAHCDGGHVEEALGVYRYILANAPFAPSSVTYKHLTKGLVQAGRIGDAVSLLREMLSKGLAADSNVYSNLIKGYLHLGELDKANEFFDELKSRCTVYDGIVNATFMEYWFEKGEDEEAMECYRSLLDKKFRMHPHTGNVLLEVFLKYGKKDEAWGLFNEMLDNHTPPNILSVNSETVSIMVNECFKMERFEEAVDTFKKVGSKPTSRPFVMDYVGYCNIVTRFCEHGMLPEAERLFAEGVSKSLPPDAPSHRAMIDAYLKAERIDDALKMLNRMVNVNLRVVADFGTRVFGELIENGKVIESAEVLSKMGEREPKPDSSIYDVVVRGLCDGGALDQAKDIIGEMVGYSVGVAPVLREFIIETFEKAERREEIEKTLNTVTRPIRRNSGQSGNTAASVPSVLGATSAVAQQPREKAPWMSQGAGSGWANGPTTAGGTYKANNGQNPSWSNTSANQQQQPWSNQTAGKQPPSWSSQAPGYQQQQSWSQQPVWSSPSAHQQSWADQTTDQQQQQANQTGHQQSWSNQTTGQQRQWGYQNSGHHQQQWANQTPGQKSAWTGQQQQPWSNQTASHQQSQWSNPTSGQVANQTPWSNSVNGHLPQQQQQQEPGSSHEWQDGEEKKVVELSN
ncbi:Pentatricopeptide repeat-containing protein [Raphanus sativus]|uniref:Pentatricopeptide repeat-containing protein At1g10270 n=1 Tax=Raphanus sativus TaxID=3726 RepID=A0A6J0JTI0_RAPSA|nr:pentatricopeptide repeat-containing protein At1g10270 [Raphanus sativus]KAJ4915371.1 Pentatricopeptide repeat-containing protein [Raphanus sativus]